MERANARVPRHCLFLTGSTMFDQAIQRDNPVDEMVIVEEWAFAISNDVGNLVTMSRMRKSFGESAGREMRIPTIRVSVARGPV